MTGRWAARLHLPTLAVAAVVVAGWFLLSWRYGAFVLPSPLAVLRGLVEIVRTGEVWRHTGASLARIAVGFGGAYQLLQGFLTQFHLVLKDLQVFLQPEEVAVRGQGRRAERVAKARRRSLMLVAHETSLITPHPGPLPRGERKI